MVSTLGRRLQFFRSAKFCLEQPTGWNSNQSSITVVASVGSGKYWFIGDSESRLHLVSPLDPSKIVLDREYSENDDPIRYRIVFSIRLFANKNCRLIKLLITSGYWNEFQKDGDVDSSGHPPQYLMAIGCGTSEISDVSKTSAVNSSNEQNAFFICQLYRLCPPLDSLSMAIGLQQMLSKPELSQCLASAPPPLSFVRTDTFNAGPIGRNQNISGASGSVSESLSSIIGGLSIFMDAKEVQRLRKSLTLATCIAVNPGLTCIAVGSQTGDIVFFKSNYTVPGDRVKIRSISTGHTSITTLVFSESHFLDSDLFTTSSFDQSQINSHICEVLLVSSITSLSGYAVPIKSVNPNLNNKHELPPPHVIWSDDGLSSSSATWVPSPEKGQGHFVVCTHNGIFILHPKHGKINGIPYSTTPIQCAAHRHGYFAYLSGEVKNESHTQSYHNIQYECQTPPLLFDCLLSSPDAQPVHSLNSSINSLIVYAYHKFARFAAHCQTFSLPVKLINALDLIFVVDESVDTKTRNAIFSGTVLIERSVHEKLQLLNGKALFGWATGLAEAEDPTGRLIRTVRITHLKSLATEGRWKDCIQVFRDSIRSSKVQSHITFKELMDTIFTTNSLGHDFDWHDIYLQICQALLEYHDNGLATMFHTNLFLKCLTTFLDINNLDGSSFLDKNFSKLNFSTQTNNNRIGELLDPPLFQTSVNLFFLSNSNSEIQLSLSATTLSLFRNRNVLSSLRSTPYHRLTRELSLRLEDLSQFVESSCCIPQCWHETFTILNRFPANYIPLVSIFDNLSLVSGLSWLSPVSLLRLWFRIDSAGLLGQMSLPVSVALAPLSPVLFSGSVCQYVLKQIQTNPRTPEIYNPNDSGDKNNLYLVDLQSLSSEFIRESLCPNCLCLLDNSEETERTTGGPRRRRLSISSLEENYEEHLQKLMVSVLESLKTTKDDNTDSEEQIESDPRISTILSLIDEAPKIKSERLSMKLFCIPAFASLSVLVSCRIGSSSACRLEGVLDLVWRHLHACICCEEKDEMSTRLECLSISIVFRVLRCCLSKRMVTTEKTTIETLLCLYITSLGHCLTAMFDFWSSLSSDGNKETTDHIINSDEIISSCRFQEDSFDEFRRLAERKIADGSACICELRLRRMFASELMKEESSEDEYIICGSTADVILNNMIRQQHISSMRQLRTKWKHEIYKILSEDNKTEDNKTEDNKTEDNKTEEEKELIEFNFDDVMNNELLKMCLLSLVELSSVVIELLYMRISLINQCFYLFQQMDPTSAKYLSLKLEKNLESVLSPLRQRHGISLSLGCLQKSICLVSDPLASTAASETAELSEEQDRILAAELEKRISLPSTRKKTIGESHEGVYKNSLETEYWVDLKIDENRSSGLRQNIKSFILDL